jgi:transcription-repair coupling factor (superfamily II helicase)
VARKRLAAIREFSDLDMKLLEETVRELRGEEVEDDNRATVNLRIDVKIDESYVPEMNQRLMVYRKVAAARSEAELQTTLAEIRDRYGPPPESVLNLAEYGRIRIAADRLGVETIDREGRLVVIKFRQNAKIDPMRLVKVVHEVPGATLAPPSSLKFDLEATTAGNLPDKALPRAARRPIGARPSTEGAPGWWTARATAGEVRAGFSKEEILRKPEANPRVKGGMFERLGSLLESIAEPR